MSDKMIPIPFGTMLKKLIEEYQEKKSFYDVPVSRDSSPDYKNAIGPAAGPHTQLAGNIIAAYAAGATHFELKTVQVLAGDDLGIQKPCIYAATEVFNTEWSTELSIEEAKSEYVKAYLLLKVLTVELGLGGPDNFEFIMSVGYDLKGIKTRQIDQFINHMMDARTSEEWQRDMAYLTNELDQFKVVDQAYLNTISPCISNTIALSTMHGCHKDEIEQIATYLLKDKGLNVYVKMNPTLLGQETVREILDHHAYDHISFDPKMFEVDIDFESACQMIQRLLDLGQVQGRVFGVKLTNTFPVNILRQELKGETMYLSGPALYPMAIEVASRLSDVFEGKLPISFSGGAEPKNVKDILETGIHPVTVSSLLLKPMGYKNLAKLSRATDQAMIPESVDCDKLHALVDDAKDSSLYHYKEKKAFATRDDYSVLCDACSNCVDICPNRANRFIKIQDKNAVVHIDDLCNECGACGHYCIKGHIPYEEKFSIYSQVEAFKTSKGPSLFIGDTIQCKYLDESTEALVTKIKWEEVI